MGYIKAEEILPKELIETIKIKEPINPPIYVNYEEETKPKVVKEKEEVKEEIKKQPQIMVFLQLKNAKNL